MPVSETTASEIRATLVDALQLDLVGPTDTDHAEEVLTQSPSKWYVTGFLAPFGARPEGRSDDAGDDELEELGASDSSEDSQTPEKAAARKALFPSSMGLSFLVSQQTKELQATVNWGDYLLIDLEEESFEISELEGKKKRKSEGWRRIPQSVSLTVPIAAMEDSLEINIPGGSGLTLVVNCRPVRSNRFAEGALSVSIFVVNYRQTQFTDKDTTFAFQTCLTVQCKEGFIPRSDMRGVDSDDWDEAVASLQYRHDYEFAVGHNVSAVAQSVNQAHCTEVCTTWIPTANVPRVEPAAIKGVQLGMEVLAKAESADAVRQMLVPMVTEYRTWIAAQQTTLIEPPQAEKVAHDLLTNASRACDRIETGLNALNDPDVLEAFRIANRVIAIARRRQLSQERGIAPEVCETPEWRPFQLAFILLNLVSIAQPDHRDRDIVDLLFFPTGGGKTEAYLGLAAFTLILRRFKHPGIQSAGMSVLMRYTLRLLTLDQLERAARLICALELERQNAPDKLGQWPFEIGLWVGQSATPNRMGKRGDKEDYSARARTLAFKRDSRSQPSPIPLERCPWCGEKFTAHSFNLYPTEDDPKNLTVACVNRDCDFRSRNPLPILTVDEPIYRRLPCFMIATVDKFAALPWVGQTGALFGRVSHHNDDEGFYSAGDATVAGKPLGQYLPPPDLIIQDELHLISGPLGTMVGLYETVIDTLCSYTNNGNSIRPKIIASTATVRRASRQIQALFGRSQVDIFPPPSPDRHDSFFAKTDLDTPGRLYRLCCKNIVG